MEDLRLSPEKGSNKKPTRKGKGSGSGKGKTSGKGHKGQKSRSGGGVPYLGFEGGQMRLGRRLPKRGFTNVFKREIAVVNLGRLNNFNDGDVVTREELIKHGVIRKNSKYVKLLSDGELNKKLTIKLYSISDKANEKLEKSGSTFECSYVERKYIRKKIKKNKQN